jgi:hypothetical protein
MRDSHPRFDWNTFSVTELMKGTKEIILTRIFWNELEQDCSDMAWTVFGTAVHKVMEGHEGEQELAEERVSMPIHTAYGTKYISGGFDLYNADTKILTDYKTTGVFSYLMKLKEGSDSEWAKQLRIYWLILGRSGFPVKAVRNVIFLKDWSKTMAKRDRSYPQTPVVTVNYSFSEVFNSEVAAGMEEDISAKITEILDYKDLPEEQIPDCSKHERWERDECWAVKKEGRKTAVKRCEKEWQATEMVKNLGPKHFVEHRPGISVKCMDYCSCSEKCSFYQNLVNQPFQESEPNTDKEAING